MVIGQMKSLTYEKPNLLMIRNVDVNGEESFRVQNQYNLESEIRSGEE